MTKYIDIVFDRSPRPEEPRFIEIEDDTGHSISLGEWSPGGTLRITLEQLLKTLLQPLIHHDTEFTGEQLHRLVIDIEAAVGRHAAGMTPLGMAVTRLAEDAYRNDQRNKQPQTAVENVEGKSHADDKAGGASNEPTR